MRGRQGRHLDLVRCGDVSRAQRERELKCLAGLGRAPSKQNAAMREPTLPKGIRSAVGDVHGRVDLLRQLRDQVAADVVDFEGG